MYRRRRHADPTFLPSGVDLRATNSLPHGYKVRECNIRRNTNQGTRTIQLLINQSTEMLEKVEFRLCENEVNKLRSPACKTQLFHPIPHKPEPAFRASLFRMMQVGADLGLVDIDFGRSPVAGVPIAQVL